MGRAWELITRGWWGRFHHPKRNNQDGHTAQAALGEAIQKLAETTAKDQEIHEYRLEWARQRDELTEGLARALRPRGGRP